MLSTPDEIFIGFGPSAFLHRRSVGTLAMPRDRRELRRQLRATCPAVPGVYGMIDNAGRLIYIGESSRLRQRLLNYFPGQTLLEPRSRREVGPRKELRIARRTAQLVWEVAGHELIALLREHELIRRFKPDMNIRGRRRRRLAHIYLSTDAAPRFGIAAKLPKSCRHQWGPFAHNSHLIRSVELLNRHFKLPDCPSQTAMWFAGDGTLFPVVDRPLCLRGEVDRCLAPCAGSTTRQAYFAQLSRARAFLDGADSRPLDELDLAIATAVKRRHFEQAARLRDVRGDLETLRDSLLPRPYEEPRSFIYPIPRGRRSTWMLVDAGHVLDVRSQPATYPAARRWLSRLEAHPRAVATVIDDLDAGQSRIVQSWFRQHPDQLARVLSLDAARDFCSQFRSA